MGVLKLFDKSLAEQVIEVPKITLQDGVPHRAALRKPQLAEQLVEVPIVVSFSSLQQLSVEQIIDIPVPHLGGRSVARSWARGLYWWLWGVTASPGRYINTGQG